MPEAVFWAGAGLMLVGSWLHLAEGEREGGAALVGLGFGLWAAWAGVAALASAL